MHSENDEEIRVIVSQVIYKISKFVMEEDSILFDSPTYQEEYKTLHWKIKNLKVVQSAQEQQRLVVLADEESQNVQHIFEQSEKSVNGIIKMLVDENQLAI